MAPKYDHFMDEADIGSGEKTPAEMDDLEDTKHLREQQEQARQQARPMDGALLQQVVEEQQYINQHESHTPHGVMDATSSNADTPENRNVEEESAASHLTVEKPRHQAEASRSSGRANH